MSEYPLDEAGDTSDVTADTKVLTAPVSEFQAWFATVVFIWFCDLPLSDWMMGGQGGGGSLMFYSLVGICLSQVTIAAMWLVLGQAKLLLRLCAEIITVGVWVAGHYVGLLSSTSHGANTTKLSFFISSTAAYFVAIWLLARLFGCEIVRQGADGEFVQSTPRERWQFSLRQLFALTTAVAMIAGILAAGYIKLPDNVPWLLFVVLALIGLNGNLMAYSMMCRSWAGRMIAIGVSFLASLALASIDTRELIPVSLTTQFFILVTLIPVRLLSYRLRFSRFRGLPKGIESNLGNEPDSGEIPD